MYLFEDMPNGDWYSYSTFDFLLNYVFQNYLRVIFDLKSRILKNSSRALGWSPGEPPSTVEDPRAFKDDLILVGRASAWRRLLPGPRQLTVLLLQVLLQWEISSPADPSSELPGRWWLSSGTGCSPDLKVRYVLVPHLHSCTALWYWRFRIYFRSQVWSRRG